MFCSFNPRTYIRYDGAAYAKTLAETKFQSTYLYKVRLEPYHGYPYGYGFNPRTYIRYDVSNIDTSWQVMVSIHVPI